MAPASGPEPGQANGLKDGAPCDGDGLREPQALDSLIPETSKCVLRAAAPAPPAVCPGVLPRVDGGGGDGGDGGERKTL